MTGRAVLGRAWSASWRIALFLVIWGVLYAPLLLAWFASEGGGGAGLGSPGSQLYINGAGAATVLLAAWVALRFFDRRPFGTLGFRAEKASSDLVFGLALGGGLMAVSVALLRVAGWAVLRLAGDISTVALLLVAVSMMLNAVIQEVLFRGYVLQAIRAESSPGIALVISSVLFVAAHGGAAARLLPSVNLFLAGILLGLAYLVSGRLWLPIGLHFGWNFLQGPILGLAVTGHEIEGGIRLVTLNGPPLVTGGEFGLEGGLAATFVTALGIAVLRVTYRVSSAPTRPLPQPPG